MRINVLGKLPPDFFKGLVSKNAEIYLDCLHIISNMNGGLSYKERYDDVKDEIRVYLADAKVRVENEDDTSFSSNLDKQPGEIISQMIRYGWLETDTAEGSKCCIIVTPLVRGRMATVCKHVVTVTTPGDCVDVLVTDYGIAVNPRRKDLIECLDKAGIEHTTIEALQEKAYSLVGTPDDLEWEDKVIAVLEARDGTILDVIRKIKPLKL